MVLSLDTCGDMRNRSCPQKITFITRKIGIVPRYYYIYYVVTTTTHSLAVSSLHTNRVLCGILHHVGWRRFSLLSSLSTTDYIINIIKWPPTEHWQPSSMPHHDVFVRSFIRSFWSLGLKPLCDPLTVLGHLKTHIRCCASRCCVAS